MSPPFLWWSEEVNRDEGTPVIVKMENPNWSISELSSPDYDVVGDHLDGEPADTSRKGPRRKNAKQLTWVLLLRAHRAAGCLASLALAFRTHLSTLRRRSSFLGLTKALVLMTVAVVLFEFVGYAKVWRFGASAEVGEKLRGVDVRGVVGVVQATWVVVRLEYLGPFLQVISKLCVVMFLVQSSDRVVMCMGAFWIKVRRLKPTLPFDDDQGNDLDLESGEKGYFPRVLVQIPMCNEREVYKQSIGAVCNLDWPRTNLLIQVLDDSDDPITQVLIKEDVAKWQQNGARIVYIHRQLREGYKAGNLKSAMSCNYVKDYQFVAIFDADFQPQPDFLKKTIPHFKGREEVGLVQARWSFINRDENLLTRLQNINLCFHFEVEQQVNGHYLNFFGFNGTAGVWRIRALQDAGGWLERTTVEDMDIAVRAHLRGWKFIFVNDVECQCELPESYEAYKKQQHRWHSGPMQLFRLCFKDIIKSNIGFWKKSNLIFLFFLIRKLILPLYSFTLFCIILPMTMFVPEVELPTWVICYIPATMSFLNVLPSPRSFPFMIPYLLFENTMSVTKFQAMLSGLMGRAYEWVVTKKLGRSSENDFEFLVDKERKLEHSMSMPNLNMAASEEVKIHRRSKKKLRRIYKNEVMLAFLLLAAAVRSLISMNGMHFYFLLFQGISFLLVGFDLIGEHTA